jgi:hypothetical protein
VFKTKDLAHFLGDVFDSSRPAPHFLAVRLPKQNGQGLGSAARTVARSRVGRAGPPQPAHG